MIANVSHASAGATAPQAAARRNLASFVVLRHLCQQSVTIG